MINPFNVFKVASVAPFAGAWIEISVSSGSSVASTSLPSRERGLKSLLTDLYHNLYIVAPFAGAWIEIPTVYYKREA